MSNIRDSGGRIVTINGQAFMQRLHWRSALREASFRGAPFHVEQQARAGGRRLVVHEYPKMDDGSPYTEDMGRLARRYQITGYVIQKQSARMIPRGSAFSVDYDEARDRLIKALEAFGPGTLVDPYNNRVGPMIFCCERYSEVEQKDRGGYAQFDMSFVEAGLSTFPFTGLDTQAQVTQASDNSTNAAANQLNIQQMDATSGVPFTQLTFPQIGG